MRTAPVLILAFALIGCAPKPESEAPATTTPAATTQSGGVAPMTSGVAGGMTPVSGGESVDGAGMGGVGSAAKDMARGAAAKAAAGPSMPPVEGGE